MASIPTFPPIEDGWASLRDRYLSHEGQGEVRPSALRRGAGALSGSLRGFRGPLSITDQRVWLKGLPDSFRSFRILHLSDIHHSLFVPLDQVAAIVELSNGLKPDLIALTGDFVTYSRSSIQPVAEILGGLRARAGVFAVLGNHDFRVDAGAVDRELTFNGIQVLRNRHARIERGGETLHVAGVDDYGYGADLDLALRGIPESAPKVLLAHNPRMVTMAAARGVSLVLSGHTHGGQVNVPLLGSLYGRTPQQLRYKIGWDRMDATQIYVSRGIGTIVLPWRWRCPAEIAQFELEPHHADSLFGFEARPDARTDSCAGRVAAD